MHLKRLSYSKISTYLECPRKYYYRYILGLVPVTKSPALALGSCLADALSILRVEGNLKQAEEQFIKTWDSEGRILLETKEEDPKRSLERGLEILNGYAITYPEEYKSIIKSEIKFEIPFLSDLDISISGRVDGIMQMNTDYCIIEDKTTSRLGDTFFTTLRDSYQILLYLWVAKQLGLFKLGQTSPKCLMNAIYINERYLRYQRDITIKSSYILDLAYSRLQDIGRRITLDESFPYANSDICNKWGKCEYSCFKYASEDHFEILKNSFRVEKDPSLTLT